MAKAKSKALERLEKHANTASIVADQQPDLLKVRHVALERSRALDAEEERLVRTINEPFADYVKQIRAKKRRADLVLEQEEERERLKVATAAVEQAERKAEAYALSLIEPETCDLADAILDAMPWALIDQLDELTNLRRRFTKTFYAGADRLMFPGVTRAAADELRQRIAARRRRVVAGGK